MVWRKRATDCSVLTDEMEEVCDAEVALGWITDTAVVPSTVIHGKVQEAYKQGQSSANERTVCCFVVM